MTINTKNT